MNDVNSGKEANEIRAPDGFKSAGDYEVIVDSLVGLWRGQDCGSCVGFRACACACVRCSLVIGWRRLVTPGLSLTYELDGRPRLGNDTRKRHDNDTKQTFASEALFEPRTCPAQPLRRVRAQGEPKFQKLRALIEKIIHACKGEISDGDIIAAFVNTFL
ncbi:hypothetical protein BOTBODRAFT_147206 [Botryobasidium botryosum FD-172 SS1]|uniref:Uncharacterized protein n=1 Tax=Botryobasidium botryosum (strain FD-172 SS1) TaxID=930990 RepID=A0A067M9W2_BOTB1|nr:hypothetical protein BOTBODRAFT_147206 [Botryobasidium botryosum FD-172 SS1]